MKKLFIILALIVSSFSYANEILVRKPAYQAKAFVFEEPVMYYVLKSDKICVGVYGLNIFKCRKIEESKKEAHNLGVLDNAFMKVNAFTALP